MTSVVKLDAERVINAIPISFISQTGEVICIPMPLSFMSQTGIKRPVHHVNALSHNGRYTLVLHRHRTTDGCSLFS